MKTLAIAGVGLLGGSLGLAFRKAGFQGSILGVSSPQTIALAIERGAVDAGVSLEEAAATADVLYLAQPISVILETIERLKPVARPGCLVTDAGSTKVRIVEHAASLPLFLGGHPLAGKESSGVAFADPDLFVHRPYVLTNRDPADLDSPAVSDFIFWLRRFGAVPVYMSAAEHDRTVAFTSHLPQMASTALALTLHASSITPESLMISGPGLQDATRLALSSWNIWKDIVGTNGPAIQHALTVYIDRLTELRDNLHTQRAGDDFSTASEVASKIRRGLKID